MTPIFTIIISSIVILGLCFAGLAITIIIKKNGEFPETEIGRNKNMQRLGIRCAKQEELSRWQNNTKPASDNPCSHCTMSCGDKRE
jgi:hypothetical protein